MRRLAISLPRLSAARAFYYFSTNPRKKKVILFTFNFLPRHGRIFYLLCLPYFFAEAENNPREFLSAGVTVDCNESLNLKVGDYIYSNLYNPLFKVIYDDVCRHDLLHPCCRPEMYDFFYGNGAGHPNCLDNIYGALKENRTSITPVNLFMNTQINPDGSISVKKPLSKAGDKIVLRAEKNITLGVAACSVSESACNGEKCTSVKIIIQSPD